jgi:hypothetical protein
MKVLLWHVHGSWTTAFVQGRHEYLLPVLPDRGPDGRGRARTWSWPSAARELAPAQLRDEQPDVVVLQRPHEAALVRDWLGREAGRDIPAVYVEHNTPPGPAVTTRHQLADRDDLPLVHVTHFNELAWDNGRAPTVVIEHGIVDPGARYTGELARMAVVVNEPARRGRAVGADLIERFCAAGPVDVFGAGVERLPAHLTSHGALPQDAMHAELARRRVYVHTTRWTSLGLSLIEAMHLGMPVIAVETTDVAQAVPPSAGVVSTDVARLVVAAQMYLDDPEAARLAGKSGRQAALARYGLDRFLTDWDRLLQEVTR